MSLCCFGTRGRCGRNKNSTALLKFTRLLTRTLSAELLHDCFPHWPTGLTPNIVLRCSDNSDWLSWEREKQISSCGLSARRHHLLELWATQRLTQSSESWPHWITWRVRWNVRRSALFPGYRRVEESGGWRSEQLVGINGNQKRSILKENHWIQRCYTKRLESCQQ